MHQTIGSKASATAVKYIWLNSSDIGSCMQPSRTTLNPVVHNHTRCFNVETDPTLRNTTCLYLQVIQHLRWVLLHYCAGPAGTVYKAAGRSHFSSERQAPHQRFSKASYLKYSSLILPTRPEQACEQQAAWLGPLAPAGSIRPPQLHSLHW